MFKRIHLVFILGLVLCGPAKAQMPWELLPVSIEQLNDSLAALRASLSTGKADTSALNALIARFVADSTAKAAKLDSLAAASKTQDDSLAIRMQRAARDSGNSFCRVAGDTTSPGMFYYLGPDNQMHRADGTTATKAIAAATDSVNKGGICRFQYSGTIALDRWKGLWGPGTALVNSVTVPGDITAIDTTRADSLKMHNLAVSADSSKGEIFIRIEPNFWTGGN